ncbi:ChaN family lipoprotein [uncultured Pelagimonas sp.]|uniref:ChaN family lipoprotein n=1 Tax=uncultured Pelagimonas sp. TaxID=1618102 RepID=UPI00262B0001|nr:ChaN family lipoprotein [uncultured Pelagimonas sp.]
MNYALIAAAMLVCPVPLSAQDVIFLGETHDNPGHHKRQTERVIAAKPRALVFEMLTTDQTSLVTPDLVGNADQLEQALGWESSGWPDFSMYYPIFAAAPEAQVFGGAVPREDARRLMSEPVQAVFGEDAKQFGLDQPLPDTQQTKREAMQMAAHCDALPENMLPMMVNMQRLRDAALARAVVQAFEETGGPVAVITGNGHARKDWGAPVILDRVAPNLDIYSLGQGEEGVGPPDGVFDEITFSPTVERDDPCAAFK